MCFKSDLADYACEEYLVQDISTLFIHSWSSEFGFLFDPLVYLRIWRNNLILECLLKSSSASLGHQSSIFKICASVHIQLGPVAFWTARGEALGQPAIGKTFNVESIHPKQRASSTTSMYGMAGHSGGHLPR